MKSSASVKLTLKVSSEKLQKLKDRSSAPSSPMPASQAASGSSTPAPKGKPGPKPGSSHTKSGPKDTDSAINSQLRALDRTGKPPRHWVKTPVQIKSFTNCAFDVPEWGSSDKGMNERGEKKVKLEVE
ncbi:INO80 complex subunit Ies4-domain-containing protein [Yarrowia lipolytica]|jgi:hypothetical protein|uniref:YALI0F05742p n=2 Tax=Yarrowia lipolytica TaxID=4952 RepID=Q6C2R6_YARLI|nr:YALI0F05742p [Yarrowia lipolytica CLIB122]AOW06716.1 hypothetical protein YALI1_F08544g [Yarrowia lipolytica]KAB8284822.1 INO80 complex subunit Ies4-domain-containing protein [Yarrowia lipolytica]KAJ8056069.1 INO80 complex subunit Ies4-domain-containing protein [Yarrowia lipolytica]QNQ00567.1 Hypothetical protein YALI2_F00112g [Yarrowia lipolytica]RDW39290.1 INO80 complex subunit Ies4-domain-containing protein [Yarrowia lipolytica]|eukprot:XP_505046.1 YALI0F05742p [Yarrowia lipolytica CLIB122]